MSDCHFATPFVPVPVPAHTPPASGERRRAGRNDNVDPALIALMRKPDHAARVRVALYDAPGFMLQQQSARPGAQGPSLARMTMALGACTGLCTLALHVMFVAWG